MTFGNILFFGGIIVSVISGLTLLISSIIFSAKKKRLKNKLYERYGI